MKQCFGYVRVSTVKQGEGVSIEAQKEAIAAYAANSGIIITKWFEEKETAAKQGRPVFNAMMRELKKSQTSGIVIHKIDRSARNFADWAKIGDLADAGFDIHFATETLDFRSRGGRLSADIQAVIAADYIRNLREECIKGLNGRLKQGLYPFGAPLGYLDNGRGKPKTPDPVRAPQVKKMFALYAQGNHSIRSLRTEMTRLGLTNRRGNPPSKHLIETMLSNPFYCGLMRVKTTGQIFPGVHAPLISARQFEQVQDVKSGKSGKKVTRHNHLYRGLFLCAHCGTAMIPEHQKGFTYYRCHTKHCATKTVREDDIENAMRAALKSLRPTKAAIDRTVAEISAWLSEHADDKSDDLKSQTALQTIDRKIENLTDALIDRLIDRDVYAKRHQALLIEKQMIEETAAQQRDALDTPDDVRIFLEHVKNLAALYDSSIGDEKREIVKTTTSNRRVRGKSIEFEPCDWLQPVRDYVCVPDGEQRRPNYRRSRQFCEVMIKELKGATKLLKEVQERSKYLPRDEVGERPMAA